jgi:hypothetical protein
MGFRGYQTPPLVTILEGLIRYAYDTLLILPSDARIIFDLKGLLRSFLDSIGLHVNFEKSFLMPTRLHVNFEKSFLMPINLSDQRALPLAHTFDRKVGHMPFTYLGLPLGTTKPSL